MTEWFATTLLISCSLIEHPDLGVMFEHWLVFFFLSFVSLMLYVERQLYSYSTLHIQGHHRLI